MTIKKLSLILCLGLLQIQSTQSATPRLNREQLYKKLTTMMQKPAQNWTDSDINSFGDYIKQYRAQVGDASRRGWRTYQEFLDTLKQARSNKDVAVRGTFALELAEIERLEAEQAAAHDEALALEEQIRQLEAEQRQAREEEHDLAHAQELARQATEAQKQLNMQKATELKAAKERKAAEEKAALDARNEQERQRLEEEKTRAEEERIKREEEAKKQQQSSKDSAKAIKKGNLKEPVAPAANATNEQRLKFNIDTLEYVKNLIGLKQVQEAYNAIVSKAALALNGASHRLTLLYPGQKTQDLQRRVRTLTANRDVFKYDDLITHINAWLKEYNDIRQPAASQAAEEEKKEGEEANGPEDVQFGQYTRPDMPRPSASADEWFNYLGEYFDTLAKIQPLNGTPAKRKENYINEVKRQIGVLINNVEDMPKTDLRDQYVRQLNEFKNQININSYGALQSALERFVKKIEEMRLDLTKAPQAERKPIGNQPIPSQQELAAGLEEVRTKAANRSLEYLKNICRYATELNSVQADDQAGVLNAAKNIRDEVDNLRKTLQQFGWLDKAQDEAITQALDRIKEPNKIWLATTSKSGVVTAYKDGLNKPPAKNRPTLLNALKDVVGRALADAKVVGAAMPQNCGVAAAASAAAPRQ